MIIKRKTMFDIVREADEDTADAIANGSIEGGDAPATGNADAGADDGGTDDDLNIDASLDTGDDNDAGGNDDFGGGDDNTDTDTGSSDTSFGGGSSGGGDTSDEEPVKNNTDIFSNLTSEEQAIKIGELKRLYNELYTSCDDYIAKFNDLDYDNIPIQVVERVATAMENLRAYMKEYILKVFPIKSYIENDYKYNEFLYAFHSIASILEDIGTNTPSKKS